ncbi:MAG: type II toxin-antitoxin system death-on-curing family toxin [Phycisphaeraceae bacterium]|nr:type II toxin-antitoxin system death-on-curing family toxin [Phycisphaeraceae bacterium]
MEPQFLRVDEVLRIHADQVERYGGSADLRDPGLLISAVETPRAMYGGSLLHGDLFGMAAAYLFHIVQNHPFVDGNKRTGTVAAIVFLDVNGVEIDADNDELAEMVLAVARGEIDKNRIARFLRERAAGL